MISLDEARASGTYARGVAAALEHHSVDDVLPILRDEHRKLSARKDAVSERCACVAAEVIRILEQHPLPRIALLLFADNLEREALTAAPVPTMTRH